jgi:hypothetical protein
MSVGSFLGHPEGSGPGCQMVLLVYLEVAPEGPGGVEDRVERL